MAIDEVLPGESVNNCRGEYWGGRHRGLSPMSRKSTRSNCKFLLVHTATQILLREIQYLHIQFDGASVLNMGSVDRQKKRYKLRRTHTVFGKSSLSSKTLSFCLLFLFS